MKEIRCLSQTSNYHHPAAAERRRVEELESLNDLYFHGLILICICAGMMTGVLLAVTSAAGML